MSEFRSGFVCLVGRPNTGKSTLTNALVGEKVAITSNRPQTTRHTIRGIVHREDFQIVLVDTPGLHRPRTLLGQRLNDLVKDTYSDVDVIGLSLLSGAHKELFSRVAELLKEEGAEDIALFAGGTIPECDIPYLKSLGFREVFTPGASLSEILTALKREVPDRA